MKSVWPLLEKFLHEAPPPATMGSSDSMMTGPTSPSVGMASRASAAGRKNIQLLNIELDALIKELESPKTALINGVDMKKLGDKLYQMKVKQESMGSGNSTSHGDGAEDETEVEEVY